jgi:hypothetical protein
MEIEVAPLLRTARPEFKVSRSLLRSADPATPWRERPKVIIDATPDTTLGAIYNEAARICGIRTGGSAELPIMASKCCSMLRVPIHPLVRFMLSPTPMALLSGG